MDPSGTYGEAYYIKVLRTLEDYFACSNWKRLFLSGGCYWLAAFLHRGINDSAIMINRVEEHCALAFADGVYDVTGRISKKDFHIADSREIRFMEKNYIPGFDTKKLEEYLAGIMA